MSMRDYPASGYYLPISKFKPFITAEQEAELQEELESYNFDAALELLNSVLPKNFPVIESVYIPSGEDTITDTEMEEGEAYALYAPEDLFEMVKNARLQYIETLGLSPEKGNWTVYG